MMVVLGIVLFLQDLMNYVGWMSEWLVYYYCRIKILIDVSKLVVDIVNLLVDLNEVEECYKFNGDFLFLDFVFVLSI